MDCHFHDAIKNCHRHGSGHSDFSRPLIVSIGSIKFLAGSQIMGHGIGREDEIACARKQRRTSYYAI